MTIGHFTFASYIRRGQTESFRSSVVKNLFLLRHLAHLSPNFYRGTKVRNLASVSTPLPFEQPAFLIWSKISEILNKLGKVTCPLQSWYSLAYVP